jgi:predicted nucleic acid-binding protein
VSVYVVDASVAVKWFLPEIHSDAALRLRNPSHRLHVPAFFVLEVGNILCKKVRRGEISVDESEVMLQSLQALPLHCHADDLLFPLAFELAHQTRRSLYDCMYLALAVTFGGQLVTADRRFFGSLEIGQFAEYLCWVEHLP